MTLFRYVRHGDRHRHIKDGCTPNVVPMLHDEAAWPACRACQRLMVAALRNEGTVHSATEPVRCSSCAAWVRPGHPCSTCGAITVHAI